MTKHFESDGNGGFRISAPGLGAILSFVILLSVFANAVVYGAGLRSDVDTLENYAEVNIKDHKSIENRLDTSKESSARMEEQLTAIHSDITDIKDDLKYLRDRK